MIRDLYKNQLCAFNKEKGRGFDLLLARERLIPVVLITFIIIGLILRIFVLLNFIDRPGDGPTKVMYAYNWYKSPYFIIHGIWLPAFTYLTGSFGFIVSNPLYSVRIFNILIGTITIPVLYLLVKKIYNHHIALISAIILAIMPLHIELSASSLTEASFLFELLLGMLLLVKATEQTDRSKFYLIGSLLSLNLALMTRYEAWLLIPFSTVYFLVKTRDKKTSLILLLCLCLFPIFWSISNYYYYGNALIGFTAAEDDTWSKSVNLFVAIKILIKLFIEQFGLIIFSLGVMGVLYQFINMLRKEASIEQYFFISIFSFFILVMTKFAMVRGYTFQARYLLFGIVFMLPMIGLSLAGLYKNSQQRFLVILLALLTIFSFPKVFGKYPIHHLRKHKPVEIIKVAEWLQRSSYRNEPVLLTKARGDATYLPLFYPDVGPHDKGHFIYYVHVGMSDERLKRYLFDIQPVLLITIDADKDLLHHIETVWNRRLNLDKPLFQTGDIKVFKIRQK